MICPKCGRPVDQAAVICPGCDFILDTSFLGEEILDEDKTLRPGIGGLDPGAFNLADAVILGDIDDTAASFETSDSGFHVKETTGARFYVSGQSQALMAPDAIPAVLADATPNVRLTPFERHVLSFIDGESPVEKIRVIAGLDETEVKTALATLADKGVVQVIGRALVDFGGTTPAEAPRRRQERRRPTGLSPLAGISDETDRAIEEAFKTQTSLAPLASLSPADGEVFSESENAFDRATHELQGLASSATPADPRAPTKVRHPIGDSASKTFVPVSNTQVPRPAPNLSSDGFDAFDAPMSLAGEARPADSGDVRPSLGAPEKQITAPIVARVEESAEDDSFSSFDVGTEAIARIANSELARVSIDSIEAPVIPARGARRPGRNVRPEDSHTRATPNPLGSSLSRLLSDAADPSDIANAVDDSPFRSSGDTPAIPRQPFVSAAKSAEDDDDYGGDEYSSADAAPAVSAEADPVPPPVDDVNDEGDFNHPTEALLAAFSDSESASMSVLASLSDSASDEAAPPDSIPDAPPSSVGFSLRDGDTATPALASPGTARVPLIGESSSSSMSHASELDGLDVPAQFSKEAPPTHVTHVGPLSDDGPALSQLIGGFADQSILQATAAPTPAQSSVFSGHVPMAAGPDESDEYPVTGPTNRDEARAARNVSDVFTRDAAPHEAVPPPAVQGLPGPPPAPADASGEEFVEFDEDSDEKTNVLEGYELAPRAAAVNIDNRVPGARIGEASDDGETQLRPGMAHPAIPRPGTGAVEPLGSDSSMEYIEEAQILGTRRITLQSAADLVPHPASVSEVASDLASEISELAPGDAGYLGSEVDSALSSQQSSVLESELSSVSYQSEVDSSSSMASSVVERNLPSSLLQPVADPNATAFVDQPSSIDSAAASSVGGWEDEGTVNAAYAKAHESTGYDSEGSEDGSSMLPNTPPPRRARTSGSSGDMQEKARRLFKEALKDFNAGRVSRARMNAKLASVYDPHNEEYRAALEQWSGAEGPPSSDGKPEEVLLYEEAHRLEGRGDIEAAIDLLQQGIALNPRIAAFHNRLGVILAIRKREFVEAARCVRRAVQLEPDNKHYRHNLGKIEKKADSAGAS